MDNIDFIFYQVYCDFAPYGQSWTLIARFSNNDTKNWMNDSGYWWYDRTEAVGETTDPSSNTDMISPAFWSVGGIELKITRSDDPQHIPLLETADSCLSGQTFRSKITDYGDFRNGATWSNPVCLGDCEAQYGGQYESTDGFQQATCESGLQTSYKLSFWCSWGESASVIMIGGGGPGCSNAGHGIGVTAGIKASFQIIGYNRHEHDFGNVAQDSRALNYSLNVWIR